jgi:hypothetical protein
MSALVRRLLVALAVLFLVWELLAVILWAHQSGGLGHAPKHFWRALRSDWMALLVVSDHLAVAGVVLVALWRDAIAKRWPLAGRFALAAAFIVLGSPALLMYLAWRAEHAVSGESGSRTG